MSSLAVPVPVLSFEEGAAGRAILEKPLQVRCGAVSFPDGTALRPERMARGGLLVYRRAGATASEVWDEEARRWRAAGALDPGTLKPVPMAFQDGEASPWQGLVVPAAGPKDAAGEPQIRKASGGVPAYSFRAYFASDVASGGLSGLSVASREVQFASFADVLRAGLGVGEDEGPTSATRLDLFLRSPSLQTIGRIQIEAAGSRSQVEITNATGASIRLLPNGDVEITPASGRSILFVGPIEAQRITYEPGGAPGTRQTL